MNFNGKSLQFKRQSKKKKECKINYIPLVLNFSLLNYSAEKTEGTGTSPLSPNPTICTPFVVVFKNQVVFDGLKMVASNVPSPS